MTAGNVVGFRGILEQIVKLGLGRTNVFPSVCADASQLGPSHIQLWEERFQIRVSGHVFACERGHEAGSVESLRRRGAEQIEERGKQVNASRLLLYAYARGNTGA